MIRRQCTPVSLLAFLVIPLLGACDDDPTGTRALGPAEAPVYLSFEVRSVTVELGNVAHLSNLLVFDSDMIEDDSFKGEWTSSDQATVCVFPDGAVLAVQLGVAVVTVNFLGEAVSIVVEVVEKAADDDSDGGD